MTLIIYSVKVPSINGFMVIIVGYRIESIDAFTPFDTSKQPLFPLFPLVPLFPDAPGVTVVLGLFVFPSFAHAVKAIIMTQHKAINMLNLFFMDTPPK